MAGAERSEVLSLFDLLDSLATQAVALRTESKDVAKAQRKQYRNAGFEPARIFYQRMADSQTVLTEERLASYASSLEAYRAAASKKRGAELLQTAAALSAYCSTHRLDPDNSLIGLCPSSRTYMSCIEDERGATLGSGSGTGTLARPKKFAAAEGDLVLVEQTAAADAPPEARWRFARVARSASDGDELVAVYLSPEERSREEVRVRSVRVLPASVLQSLGQAKSMQRLVSDPFEAFIVRLQEDVKAKTRKFLGEQGLDTELLEDVVNKPNEAPPLSVLPRLKQLIQGLLMLNSRLDLLSAFYDEVNAAADRKIVSFLAEVDRQHVFLPMKAENLKHLETFNFSSFATNRIRTCYGRCDACMDTMKIALKDLTNGQAKNRLTRWWLERIEAETTAFLRSKKYVFDAYPSEYLQAPPENIQPVKFNLQLIREILNPLDDKHGTQEFVQRLKDEIYPKIDEFVLSALIVLNQVLPTVAIDNASPDVAELERVVAAGVANKEPEQARWMTELVKDLKYLARMRQLETSGERVLDVVPVSGLVLSQFYRLENELKTVIELWDVYLQEQAQMKGEKTYQRLKTKIYLWRVADPHKVDVMKEFGGTSCIMQLETGGFFSAALTEHGEVYAWGRGLSGELGIGEKKHSDEPLQVEGLRGKKVVQISCGGAVCAAVTADGELYLWGYLAVFGAPLLVPTLIEAAHFNHVRIREVSVGSQHVLVLLDSSEVYAWGKGHKGQLGLGALKDREKPSLVEGDLRSRKIRHVRAGEDISAAVTEAGELYVWGRNDEQLLGTAASSDYLEKPARVAALAGRLVVDVALGSRHVAALTDAGEVFLWGCRMEPALVADLPGRALKVACGQFHAVVCTDTDVLTWRIHRSAPTDEPAAGAGSRRAGGKEEKDAKKSVREREPRAAPKREMEVVEELRGKHVLQVACGSVHTAVLVENPAFFGVPLTAVMEREKGRRVPSMVQKMCAYLSNRIATEHLFRTVGRAAQVSELRKDFDRDEDVNLFRCRDPHTVTSLLKEYLKMLPEPLIPYDHVDAFLSLVEPSASQQQGPDPAKFPSLCALVASLPGPHRDLLCYLLVFWAQVASRAEQNKMNAQQLAIFLAPVVFRRRESAPSRLSKEEAILASNTVLRWLITWGRAFADETPESLASQAAAWATTPQGRADTWQLWALRLDQEADGLPAPTAPASASQPNAPPPLPLSLALLTSSALDASLASALSHDVDAQEAALLSALFTALLRPAEMAPEPRQAAPLEAALGERLAAATQRTVSEERVEEFVAEEAKRARDAAGVLAARVALLGCLSRHAAKLRAYAAWARGSEALSAFRAHTWPLESGWRVLEAAGSEVAPVLRRAAFADADLAPLVSAAQAREMDEALACLTAAETFIELRRAQANQLSFVRKKLQSAQQAGNAASVQSLQAKFSLMRDALVAPADLQPAKPAALMGPLLSIALPPPLEARRTAIQAAIPKLEALLSELHRTKP